MNVIWKDIEFKMVGMKGVFYVVGRWVDLLVFV